MVEQSRWMRPVQENPNHSQWKRHQDQRTIDDDDVFALIDAGRR